MADPTCRARLKSIQQLAHVWGSEAAQYGTFIALGHVEEQSRPRDDSDIESAEDATMACSQCRAILQQPNVRVESSADGTLRSGDSGHGTTIANRLNSASQSSADGAVGVLVTMKNAKNLLPWLSNWITNID
jgi:hypothetical protein